MTKENYGADQGEKGKEGFEAWWQQELGRKIVIGEDKPMNTNLSTIKELAYDAFVAGMVWSVES